MGTRSRSGPSGTPESENRGQRCDTGMMPANLEGGLQTRGREARQRLRRGMIEVVCEVGYARATVALVCERARLGLSDFDQVFSGREDAFLDAFEEQGAILLSRCRSAYSAQADWILGLHALGGELAGWLREHPREARFLIVESNAAGESVQLRREALIGAFVEMVDEGRSLQGEPLKATGASGVMVVGGVVEVLTRRLALPREITAAEAARTVPELLYFALRPYLGHSRAVEESSFVVEA
jgi:AcrR family transcriptional regulator